jgi:hypothetical protein
MYTCTDLGECLDQTFYIHVTTHLRKLLGVRLQPPIYEALRKATQQLRVCNAHTRKLPCHRGQIETN